MRDSNVADFSYGELHPDLIRAAFFVINDKTHKFNLDEKKSAIQCLTKFEPFFFTLTLSERKKIIEALPIYFVGNVVNQHVI